jgi:hypothetical protein
MAHDVIAESGIFQNSFPGGPDLPESAQRIADHTDHGSRHRPALTGQSANR